MILLGFFIEKCGAVLKVVFLTGYVCFYCTYICYEMAILGEFYRIIPFLANLSEVGEVLFLVGFEAQNGRSRSPLSGVPKIWTKL